MSHLGRSAGFNREHAGILESRPLAMCPTIASKGVPGVLSFHLLALFLPRKLLLLLWSPPVLCLGTNLCFDINFSYVCTILHLLQDPSSY